MFVKYIQGPLGERLAHVSYLNLDLVDLNRRPSRDTVKRPPDNFWDVLVRRLKMRHLEPLLPRFSHSNVMRLYRQAEMEEAAGKVRRWSLLISVIFVSKFSFIYLTIF